MLLVPDLSGISNQHPSSQTQSRNEIWRSETVLQVFIDIWMSVEQFDMRNIEVWFLLLHYTPIYYLLYQSTKEVLCPRQDIFFPASSITNQFVKLMIIFCAIESNLEC